MQSVVTAKVKLPSNKVLLKTMKVYSDAVQFCVDVAWREHIRNRVKLHRECYYALREKFRLQSQLLCNAIKQAVEMVKKAQSKPEIKEYMSIRYNFPRCASISSNWETLSLSTIQGRRKFSIHIPECYQEYLCWDVRESNLVRDQRGRLFFCFVFAKEVDIHVTTDCKIVGVDLGVNTLAVTSTAKFYGKTVKAKRIRHERFVAQLQSKGTRATKRKLKANSGKWKRFQTWMNHNISRQIVNSLERGDVLVMENLKNIRRTAKHNKWVHKWAFRQLQFFLEYKATMKGIRVVYVEARNTSKRCNRCHSTDTTRHSGFFKCNVCGHSLNADLNGARNIAQAYMAITGLGSCKRPLGLACDDSEAVSNGIEVKHS